VGKIESDKRVTDDRSKMMRVIVTVALGILGVAAVPSGANAGAKSRSADPPAQLVGTWDVEHVAVDGQDTIHGHYRTDEPEFVGRTLVLDATGKIKFGGDLTCAQRAWKPRAITWDAVFRKAYQRTPVGGRPPAATPHDFGLDLGADERGVAYSICPSPQSRAEFPLDRWIALRQPGVLFLHVGAEYLLVLRRRPDGARPAASFDCAKASNPTEKTICGSFDLAAWDRSVDLALRQAIEKWPAKTKLLRDLQAAWLVERNACGVDAKCIDEKLWRRVGLIPQLAESDLPGSAGR